MPNEPTALMIAIENGNAKFVEKLLEAGADVKTFQEDGSTALVMAKKYRNAILVRKLLQSGALTNMFNNRGENALKVCLASAHFESNETTILLYAAGEKLDLENQNLVPNLLKEEIEKTELKHLCRQAIRKHLIEQYPHLHLFNRIPQLQLPELLSGYSLYNVSLEFIECK